MALLLSSFALSHRVREGLTWSCIEISQSLVTAQNCVSATMNLQSYQERESPPSPNYI